MQATDAGKRVRHRDIASPVADDGYRQASRAVRSRSSAIEQLVRTMHLLHSQEIHEWIDEQAEAVERHGHGRCSRTETAQ